MMSDEYALNDIANLVWASKYRLRGTGKDDNCIQETWDRVAEALSAVEPVAQSSWAQRFRYLLSECKFLPGGRILAGAGTGRNVTLFNCFVMGQIEDSMNGIFEALKEGAVTMQMGGGVGYDFSTLRPRGMPARRVGSTASGPVSFMHIWDSMCATVLSSGFRRGAMMATLRCDHPDIETFITAKQQQNVLRRFNLSVLVSDKLIQAVENDEDWSLLFPDPAAADGESVMSHWPGYDGAVRCRVFRRLKARDLWHQIISAAYDYAEPGVLFIDRINQWNNLYYCEQITATNPCGEIPLQPYGCCNLGSINLTRFVREPFTSAARIDMHAIEEHVQIAVRLLDNVIECSLYPLPQQQDQASATRRIGMGMTGLADTLIMLGLSYGENTGREMAARIMATICHRAYRSSIELAKEKGVFPLFDADAYLQSPFITSLPKDIVQGIKRYGLRNSHLLAIAPTGTISLLAGNVSSGVEPVFAQSYSRRVMTETGERDVQLQDYAVQRWQQKGEEGLPPFYTDASRLSPRQHLDMQAALQPFVDNAISKTVNVPQDCDFAMFESLYMDAYRVGLKGCTVFRPNPVSGAILQGCAPCESAPVSPG
ncbi:adenosylcobalamin-dependent ribonucleoside-diphosphate reductase [Methylophaga sp. OBS4]|uniref:adenosylcobalamin-dependent ribonucleoside-diphosphate reductase n=1 Tax=Methylophaga sp. OBS4 TaxID=2991935 RepID=UPI00225B1539|nr:adenosylcobalamin-dependent ribonucleoside-diphosphate reductase [Methylophaga sp. OBS4]MCX4188041.1 adenosylcobalamin-dependent ribonucleoside-diphosphate reductase [Methylophaga sp. OBS4]